MKGEYQMASITQNLSHAAERKAVELIVDQILKHRETATDREKFYLQLVDWAQMFFGKAATPERMDAVRAAIQDPDNRWFKYINKILDEADPHYAKVTLMNLGYEAFFRGTKMIRANREKYHCNIPWLILFDPTSACNMHCVGCWSGTYGAKHNLSFEDMDKIVTQGKALGTYLYLMTGGEPMVRWNDIKKLAAKHNDCEFAMFSNSTLITEDVCKDVVKLGNITYFLSIEGTPETNDARRGQGHYDACMRAMDLSRNMALYSGLLSAIQKTI